MGTNTRHHVAVLLFKIFAYTCAHQGSHGKPTGSDAAGDGSSSEQQQQQQQQRLSYDAWLKSKREQDKKKREEQRRRAQELADSSDPEDKQVRIKWRT